jgi:hypothetical protein
LEGEKMIFLFSGMDETGNKRDEEKKGIKRRSYHTLAQHFKENSLPNEISEFKLKIQENARHKKHNKRRDFSELID